LNFAGVDALLQFIAQSSFVMLLVTGILSLYFIAVLWVFLYRFFALGSAISKEKSSLESRFKDHKGIGSKSRLDKCLKSGRPVSLELLNICKRQATKEATKGMTFLSIVASTSPFIGLFGTIVKILDSFAKLGIEGGATLSVIAPVISEALIATAAGILVAIPAYSFHLLLKRRAFELVNTIEMQIDLLLTKKE
jgi:biopolymer transport protein ExbB/TolQ